MKTLLTLLTVLLSIPSFTQDTKGLTEDLPYFPGCEALINGKEKQKCSNAAMISYISENLIYSDEAKKNDIEGKVLVQITINKLGKLEDVKIIESPHKSLSKSAMDLFDKMSEEITWEPGTKDGSAISTQLTIPIIYKMDSSSSDEKIYTEVEQMPRFPQCEKEGLTGDELNNCAQRKMLEYMYSKLKYPPAARKKSVQGTVITRFTINRNGKMKNLEILRDPGTGLGESVMDVMETMQRQITWIPGMKDGKTVNVSYTLPVQFKL